LLLRMVIIKLKFGILGLILDLNFWLG